MNKKVIFYASFVIIILLTGVMIIGNGCSSKVELVKVGQIPDNEFEPAEWGKVYPLEYESWLKTQEPRPEGKSKYRKGWDKDKVIWDKLSEYPFMALLFNGWGFGIEYNEARGHFYMVTDQLEVDRSRIGAGGACLTCKTPYMNKLNKEHGEKVHKMPYLEAIKLIPEKHRTLGAACIDCHDNKTMDLSVERWTMEVALKDLGIEQNDLSRQQKRSLVCAQCHVTYSVMKNKDKKSVNIKLPWAGSTWGNISIENIIKVLKKDKNRLEWKQKVTGFRLPFIRHPEFELFSKQSVHFKAGVACADCHMPYTRVGSSKISDHNVMSPLKNDLRACVKCHPQSEKRLREQVYKIQDRTTSLMIRAGYAVSTTAKLFELAHQSREKGKSIPSGEYEKAKDLYFEAFFRLNFIGAENSAGFHNPTEAGRVLGDTIAYAAKTENILRQALTAAGISIPRDIQLEIKKYINNRGKKKLNFRRNQEVRDPYGTQEKLTPRTSFGI